MSVCTFRVTSEITVKVWVKTQMKCKYILGIKNKSLEVRFQCTGCRFHCERKTNVSHVLRSLRTASGHMRLTADCKLGQRFSGYLMKCIINEQLVSFRSDHVCVLIAVNTLPPCICYDLTMMQEKKYWKYFKATLCNC